MYKIAKCQIQLRQILGVKTRLERQMDGLDVIDTHYDRKILDSHRRYDEQYGKMEEIETQIDEMKGKIRSIRQEKISGDNIYQLLPAFDEIYSSSSEAEQKEFMRAFIVQTEIHQTNRSQFEIVRTGELGLYYRIVTGIRFIPVVYMK